MLRITVPRNQSACSLSWFFMYQCFQVHGAGAVLFLTAAFSAGGRPNASQPIGCITFLPCRRWKRDTITDRWSYAVILRASRHLGTGIAVKDSRIFSCLGLHLQRKFRCYPSVVEPFCSISCGLYCSLHRWYPVILNSVSSVRTESTDRHRIPKGASTTIVIPFHTCSCWLVMA